MTEATAQAQGWRGTEQDDLQAAAGTVAAALPTPTGERAGRTSEETQPTTVGRARARTDLDARGDFTTFAHRYIRDYINLADQKATLFFTGGTALLAFMYNKNVSERWLIKAPMQWNILDTVAFLAMAALALGAFLALLVVIPRMPGSRRGFLFWEAIAEYKSGRDYSDDLGLLSGPSLVQVKAEHCYDLAVVCRRKYRMLRCALWTGAVGLAGALFVFLFL